MKKIALAAAIAVVAGSASAATVYEGKGLKYSVKGDWQVQLRQDVGDDQKLNVDFDDLEIKNAISYDLGDNLKAIGKLDFGFKDAANDKSDADSGKLEEAAVGFDFGSSNVLVGKTNSASDEFGVEMQIETKDVGEDAFDSAGETSGDDLVRFEGEFDAVTVVAAYEIEAESEDSADDSFFDIFVAGEFGDVTAGAAYQSIDDTADTSIFGIFAEFDAGVATVAFDWSAEDSDAADDVTVWNLAAAFKANKQTKIAVGMINEDEEGSDDVNEMYANVTYKFASQKNVSVFAEIADSDKDNSDMGYLAGMRIKF